MAGNIHGIYEYNILPVGVKFEPIMRSAPLGCNAAMNNKFLVGKLKETEIFKWFSPPME